MGYPIIASRTTSGNTPRTERFIEKLAQTFKAGTPVQLDNGVDGGVKEWAATVGTDLIAGFATEDAQNISATGLDAPGPMKAYGGVGSALTYGSVPNQTNANKFARGGPVQDGRVSFIVANKDTIFEGQVKSDQTTTNLNPGISYGLTKDADNLWYVDLTKTGADAVVKVVALHPNDGPKLGGRVLFIVEDADEQIAG